MTTQWNRVGYQFGAKCIVLRGKVVESASKGKFWEYDPVNKDLILSAYHLTEENMPKYIQKIRDFKPDFIRAYPSTITIMARFMKENDIAPFPCVKALLCGSENLYPPQRELLEAIFQCRVYSWYGHGERAVLAGECEYSNFYHIFPEYGLVELIGENGKSVTKEEAMGEIVATGLNNYVFPFIRYKTMDLGIHTSKKCECGREYPLLKRVEGRMQELIVAKDKRLITLTALIFAQHFKAHSKIKEMQLVQEEEGRVLVRIVKTNEYSVKDEQEIRQKMQKNVDNQLDITFDYVDEIPRTARGKYRFLIQKLPIELGDTE